jgi:hypothetical protein
MLNKILKEGFFYLIGIVFILGFFWIAAFLTYKVIPPENKDMMGGILETLKNGTILILGYFYGSSKGSSDKNDMMKPTAPE